MKLKKYQIFGVIVIFSVIVTFQNCTRTKFNSYPEGSTETSSNNDTLGGTPEIFPPAGPSNCASQTYLWNIGAASCSVMAPAMTHGQTGVSLSDTDGTFRGTANVRCSNGSIILNTAPAAICGNTSSAPSSPTIYKERAKFLKGLYKKSVDTQAIVATGYHSSTLNNIAYCLQRIGDSHCNSSVNYIPFSTSNPMVNFFFYSQNQYSALNLGAGQYLGPQEIFLSISLAGVATGVYEIRIEKLSYFNGYGWSGNSDEDEILMTSGIATLED